MAIAAFFASHWLLAVFFQSFFHHRYGAHRMFSMSRAWERFFYLGAYVVQGSSFLDPRGYGILHRLHHAFSDGARDPHSPENHTNVWSMMWATKREYDRYAHHGEQPEPRFMGGLPSWPAVDRIGQSWASRFVFMGLYTAFYVTFATAWWQYLLLPVHFIMGPVHGAIVNWCGHRYGYRNFALPDKSRNSLVVDMLCVGELYQNNHHKYPMSPDFAARWFEFDPTFAVMRVLAWLGIIEFGAHVQRMRLTERAIARAGEAGAPQACEAVQPEESAGLSDDAVPVTELG
ncbi:MAG: acyl-CoA desaturase [Nannocystaceae bacterium]|nr:acyl-CoA desaturase [Nannocystaceae bacterium]